MLKLILYESRMNKEVINRYMDRCIDAAIEL